MRLFEILIVFLSISISKSFVWTWGYQFNARVMSKCFCRREDLKMEISADNPKHIRDKIETDCGGTNTLVVENVGSWYAYSLRVAIFHKGCNKRNRTLMWLEGDCKYMGYTGYPDYIYWYDCYEK